MSIEYFKSMAEKAKIKYIRDYWLRRKEGAEALERRLVAKRKTEEALAQRKTNNELLARYSCPKVSLDSKHPHGVHVNWEKPSDWNPDTYMVLVRSPGEAWRSVASSNISRDTRKQTLTKSYLAWGSYREPYEIAVAAVWEGVGRKVSAVYTYPPSELEPQTQTGDVEVEAESDEPEELGRMDQIIQAILSFTGRRTRSGKPYVRDLRKQSGMPKITVRERNAAYRKIKEGNENET